MHEPLGGFVCAIAFRSIVKSSSLLRTLLKSTRRKVQQFCLVITGAFKIGVKIGTRQDLRQTGRGLMCRMCSAHRHVTRLRASATSLETGAIIDQDLVREDNLFG